MFEDDESAETVYFVKNFKAGPFNMKYVAARRSKEFGRCFECGEAIDVGESYWSDDGCSYCLSCVAPEDDPQVADYLMSKKFKKGQNLEPKV